MARIGYCPIVGGQCNKSESEMRVQENTFFLGEPFRPSQDRKRRQRAVRNALKEALGEGFSKRSLTVADKEPKEAGLFCDICRLIQSKAYGIVDISGLNSNVLLELGMMFALGKPVFVLFKRSEEEDIKNRLPSDIVWKRVVPYDEFIDIEEELSKLVQSRPRVEPEPSLGEEARRVIAEIDPEFAQAMDTKLQEIRMEQEEGLKNLEKLLEDARLSETIQLTQEIEIPRSLEKGIDELHGKVERIEKLIGLPQDPVIARLRANWHYHRKEYVRALDLYDWALTLKPDWFEVWASKGIVLGKLGKHEEAIACFDKAIDIKEDFENAWVNKGVALGRLGKYEEAIACFDKAIDIKEDFENAWVNKGVALQELGKYEEAIACFDKAIDIKEDFEDAWRNKGVTLGKCGRWEQAKCCYEKALEINPSDPLALGDLSEALLVLGEDLGKGLEMAEKALGLAKEAEDKAISWFLCFVAHLFRGENERAREAMEGLISYLAGLEKGLQVTGWDFALLLPTIEERLGVEDQKRVSSLISLLKGEIGLEELEGDVP